MRPNPFTIRSRTVVLVAGALAALTACSGGSASTRDASGAVTKAGTWSVFDLRRGDCLKPDAEAAGEVAKVALVPCAQPHGQEVFAMVKHPADAFPGVASLGQWADAQCVSELQTSLRVSPDDGYYISYLLPSFDSWNKRKDRSVTCVLVFPNEPSHAGGVVTRLLSATTATAVTTPTTTAAAPTTTGQG